MHFTENNKSSCPFYRSASTSPHPFPIPIYSPCPPRPEMNVYTIRNFKEFIDVLKTHNNEYLHIQTNSHPHTLIHMHVQRPQHIHIQQLYTLYTSLWIFILIVVKPNSLTSTKRKWDKTKTEWDGIS